MNAEELLEIAESIPQKPDGRNVWAKFRPAAFVLRDKGYHWGEIATIISEGGEPVANIDSFCASMSRTYNAHLRKLKD